MTSQSIIELVVGVILLLILVLMVIKSWTVIQQGTFGVVTRFGKYNKIVGPGLHFLNPITKKVFKLVSIQNSSSELSFQAITFDQANVYFKAMILYAVKDSSEDTIKNVAFKFVDSSQLAQALTKTIEGVIRAFVAGKKQSEILSLRQEIVTHTKDQLDQVLAEWGYHLLDVQMNDITFDKAIMESMSRVVAALNSKAAAENEGQALLITKTKAAEAEGNYIKIQAAAEKDAAELRGQGVAAFRREVAKGVAEAQTALANTSGGTEVIMLSMWTEAMAKIATEGNGNMMFFDGSIDGMERTLKAMVSMQKPI